MTACGKIRIPINEILRRQNLNRGVPAPVQGDQHIALASSDIYQTIRTLRGRGTSLCRPRTPTTRRSTAGWRGIREDLGAQGAAHPHRRLPTKDGILLQIFTDTVIGPVFFGSSSARQRGVRRGNFQALFESIELDQIRRGVLIGTEQGEKKGCRAIRNGMLARRPVFIHGRYSHA